MSNTRHIVTFRQSPHFQFELDSIKEVVKFKEYGCKELGMHDAATHLPLNNRGYVVLDAFMPGTPVVSKYYYTVRGTADELKEMLARHKRFTDAVLEGRATSREFEKTTFYLYEDLVLVAGMVYTYPELMDRITTGKEVSYHPVIHTENNKVVIGCLSLPRQELVSKVVEWQSSAVIPVVR